MLQLSRNILHFLTFAYLQALAADVYYKFKTDNDCFGSIDAITSKNLLAMMSIFYDASSPD
ncbi:hypothetical protein HJC23_010269 [Cyclotella cryptica]|uniref:Uncharacterized protein n=1 Tax=Cyclotella cryptica TaxID=29204 RepID=A0ABD3Q0V9_9STRA